MKKIIQFIKYNNAFVIIMGLIFAVSGGVFANETSRDAIIGKTIITRQGVDNSQIVGANLGGFNMDFKIIKIMEDERGYSVSYSFNTIYIKDNVWQPLIKEGEMYVAKAGLGDKDLGLYVAEELGQKADHEIAYLREVQSIEKSKGEQKQTESVEYTGLKGLVFDSENREISGYKPVKEETEKDKTIVIDATALTIKAIDNKEENSKSEKDESEKVVQQITVVKEMVSKETIMEMVREAMAQEQGGGGSASASSSSSSVSSTETASSSSSATSEVFPSSQSSSSSTTLPAEEVGEVSSSSADSSDSSSSGASSESSSVTASSSQSSATSEVFPSSQSSSSSTTEVSSSSADISSSSSESSLPASSSSSEQSSASSAGGAEPSP